MQKLTKSSSLLQNRVLQPAAPPSRKFFAPVTVNSGAEINSSGSRLCIQPHAFSHLFCVARVFSVQDRSKLRPPTPYPARTAVTCRQNPRPSSPARIGRGPAAGGIVNVGECDEVRAHLQDTVQAFHVFTPSLCGL